MTVWCAGWNSTLHTRQSSIQNKRYKMSHKYNCFSWWWSHSRPKHVEKRNKHTKKNCAPSRLYLQDYTQMYVQHNIKFNFNLHEGVFINFMSTVSWRMWTLYSNRCDCSKVSGMSLDWQNAWLQYCARYVHFNVNVVSVVLHVV